MNVKTLRRISVIFGRKADVSNFVTNFERPKDVLIQKFFER